MTSMGQVDLRRLPIRGPPATTKPATAISRSPFNRGQDLQALPAEGAPAAGRALGQGHGSEGQGDAGRVGGHVSRVGQEASDPVSAAPTTSTTRTASQGEDDGEAPPLPCRGRRRGVRARAPCATSLADRRPRESADDDAPCRSGPEGVVFARISDGDALVAQPGQQVDLLAVDTADVHLEVQVRAGRLAPVAEQGDGVAGGRPGRPGPGSRPCGRRRSRRRSRAGCRRRARSRWPGPPRGRPRP